MAKADWFSYQTSIGDRTPMFRLVDERFGPRNVLYLGSYVDLSPSMVWPNVTYVDVDKRARAFFSDVPLLDRQLAKRDYFPAEPSARFLHGDFNEALTLDDQAFDLVVSLYSGPSVDAAMRYLAPGGMLLTNNSHGDTSLALLRKGLEPAACITHQNNRYSIITESIDVYFAFDSVVPASKEGILSSGRGLALKKSSFAQLFRRKSSLVVAS